MSGGVSFGKADANGVNSPDDASEQDEEGLKEQVRKLRQKLQEERLARKKLEKAVEDLQKQVAENTEKIEEGGTESPEDQEGLVEIEWKARKGRYDDMTANEERAVKIWEAWPNHGERSPSGLRLTMNYSQLRKAISQVDRRPKKEVRSATVKRVRNKLVEMSEGLVSVKEKESTDRKRRHRAAVEIEVWAEQRKEGVVKRLLSNRDTASLSSGGGQ